MEIVVDLSPEVVQMLDYHRARLQADRSSFLNYLIALYDQNTREYHQQVQYQQPTGYVQGLEPVESIKNIPPQKQFKLCRNNKALPRGTKAQATVIRQKSKTIPKNTARRMK
ncbi:hypothetical protein [Methanosarcina sp.]|uniref:hypothetical protein n=1 Tax=Methanosarcina sp. TaxID=2213 RepID=UPI002C85E5DA|nr:hypothetical protein [Methanosarcina sp.]HOW13496.1 hypothetical protein [Methanosarcina sp.]